VTAYEQSSNTPDNFFRVEWLCNLRASLPLRTHLALHINTADKDKPGGNAAHRHVPGKLVPIPNSQNTRTQWPRVSMMDIEDEHNHMRAAFGLRYWIGQSGTPAAE
jgi:hypothetical protein